LVEARVYSSVVEFRQDGVRIAQHERSYERAQQTTAVPYAGCRRACVLE
jgi:hypothetical protein